MNSRGRSGLWQDSELIATAPDEHIRSAGQQELPQRMAPIQHKSLELGAVQFNYTECGSGRPLLLVASPLVLGRTYRPTVQALAEHFRVVTVELPGSGRSSKLTAGASFEQYANWLVEVLDSLHLDRPIVVGHSNSGAAALLIAAEHPEMVAGLVLADSVGADGHRSTAELLVARAVDCLLEPWLTLTGWPHVAYNLLWHGQNFFCQIQLAADADLMRQAKQVNVPTLIAWGQFDMTLPVRFGRRFAEVIPDSRLHIERFASHDMLIVRPRAFAAQVRAFAEQLPDPAR